MTFDNARATRRAPAVDGRAQLARAGQIVEYATDAIIAKDLGGVIASWNLGAERLYGYGAQEALGRPISFLIPDSLEGEEWELLKRVLAGEHIDYYETRRVHKNGALVNVSLTLFALRDIVGEIVGAASIAHDISRQVAAEQELRHSEGRHRQILESAHEGIWRIGADMVSEYVNPSLARMLGYPVDEMIGCPPSGFFAKGELAALRATIERQNQGVSEHIEVALLHRNGGRVRTLMSVNAMLDDAGNNVGNLAIVSDITHQRETESNLRHAETFLAGVAASMQEGLLTLDVHGRIATANEAAARMLGRTSDELIGETICSGVGCGGEPTGACLDGGCQLVALTSSHGPIQLENETFTRKDGTLLAVEASSAPLGDRQGVTLGQLVVFHDIGESRRDKERAQRELDELSWIGRLRDAIDEDRLLLAAQPIVVVSSGEPCGRELLVRLRDRAGDLVMPATFLPAAERFGLINDVDRWVIARAARIAASGQAVNINLSADSLGNGEMGGFIERAIRQENADPELITFEITETALSEHIELATKLTSRVAKLGCGFALDDFGTGYGAFTYLKTLPIKHLKIDIEFVRDLLKDEASEHLVRATVHLARSFGQSTVAEGVEDIETLQRLRELGVDYAQGYYFGRPEVVK
jgi:PAS domain S-box-containing protein